MTRSGMVFRKRYRDRKTGEWRETATYYVRYYLNGKQAEESTGSRKRRDAEDLLKRRVGDVARGALVVPQMGRLTFTDAIEGLYSDYSLQGRRTLGDVRRRVRLHLSAAFGHRRLSAIATADLRRYTSDRQAAGASTGTIRLELAIVKRAFKLAFRDGAIATVPYIPMPAAGRARQGFFEADQFRAVVRNLPSSLQPAIAFAYLTGWRIKSEVLPLKWSQVDFEANEVRLEPGTTKNGEGRTFVLTPELKALLGRQRASCESLRRDHARIVPWVFHRAGERIKDFRKSWSSATAAAGCPGRIPHDFRRTAVRNLVRAGVSEVVAMKMTGHKTRAVFDRYNITSGTDLKEAALKLAATTDSVMSGLLTGASADLQQAKGSFDRPHAAMGGTPDASRLIG